MWSYWIVLSKCKQSNYHTSLTTLCSRFLLSLRYAQCWWWSCDLHVCLTFTRNHAYDLLIYEKHLIDVRTKWNIMSICSEPIVIGLDVNLSMMNICNTKWCWLSQFRCHFKCDESMQYRVMLNELVYMSL